MVEEEVRVLSALVYSCCSAVLPTAFPLPLHDSQCPCPGWGHPQSPRVSLPQRVTLRLRFRAVSDPMASHGLFPHWYWDTLQPHSQALPGTPGTFLQKPFPGKG